MLTPLALIIVVLGLAALAYGGVGRSRLLRDKEYRWRRATIATAGFIHGVVALASASFFFVTPGAEIRPMGYSALLFLMEFLSVFVVLPLAIASIKVEGAGVIGAMGIVLAFTPFFLGITIVEIAESVVGFKEIP